MNETKEKLLDCAFSLVQQRGVNAVSYQDLSDRIGIKKASIHYHFPKKEDLILSLLDRCQNNYGAEYESIANSKDKPKVKLERIAQIYRLGVLENKLCVIAMLSSEKDSLEPETQNHLAQAIEETICIFEKIFIQAKREKGKQPRGPSKVLARTFFHLLIGSQIMARSSNTLESFDSSIAFFLKTV
ncbi:MAG: TetR/AcrR family transcriptional regulator, partial [Leptospiraceae bacterium]|nr:TetR/AcrR family transcriptional regulator [Leptospiraceae bacterium]